MTLALGNKGPAIVDIADRFPFDHGIEYYRVLQSHARCAKVVNGVKLFGQPGVI